MTVIDVMDDDRRSQGQRGSLQYPTCVGCGGER